MRVLSPGGSSNSSDSDRDFVFVTVDKEQDSDRNVSMNRKRVNIFRMYKSLSRFQRSLLWVGFALCCCTGMMLLVTFRRIDLKTNADNNDETNIKGAAASYRKTAPHHPKSRSQYMVRPPDSRRTSVEDAREVPDDADVISVRFANQSMANNQLLPSPSVHAVSTVGNPDKPQPELPYPVVPQPKMARFKGPENKRQTAVVNAFKHAWRGYKDFAWGHDHLKPVAKSYSEWFGVGLTILDNLDTLLIMGLDAEFNEAKTWVEQKLNFASVDKYVSFFETTIRCLGGLLSAFHLSGEKVFLEKATDLGNRLLSAFNNYSSIPYSDVNLATKMGKPPMWGQDSSLSEVTSVQLEFRDLSYVTGNPIYEQKAFNVSQHIHADGCEKFDGICPMFLSPKTGKFKSGYTLTMGARTDSFYEYLLKQWLQTGKKIDWLKEDYLRVMKAVQKHLVRYSEPNKLTFIGELIGERTFSPKMDHLVCYIAGTLALGALNGLPKEHLDLAHQIAHTCYQMYTVSSTGLGPEIAHFNVLPGSKNDLYIKPLDAHSLLRPEAIEAFFYLHRITGEKKYQDWGWTIFESIEKYAKTPYGYTSIQNVKRIPVQRRDMMESFFLAETLKYLYLLFADDQTSLLPLSDYVFNTEAHPLPVHKS